MSVLTVITVLIFIVRLFNSTALVLSNSSNLGVIADLEGRQRLQQALFPERIRYYFVKGYWNSCMSKAFNVIETLKADSSKMAGWSTV